MKNLLFPQMVLFAICITAAIGAEKIDKLDSSIPVTDMHKAAASKSWKNPELTVSDSSIKLTSGSKFRSSKTTTEEKLRTDLISLPKSDWSYGRIVRVQENGISSGSASTRDYRTRTIKAVESVLKKLDIKADRMPSA